MTGAEQPFQLDGRVAIVTGSSRGIGRAIAIALAGAGARVAVSSRSQTACDAVAGEINAEYGAGRALGYAADLSDKGSMESLVLHTRETFGPIGILVGNAAQSPHVGPIAAISDEHFLATLSGNLLSNHWLVQLVVPDMIARRDGAIVFVGSVGGFIGSDMIGAYNIAKAGLMQMVRNLAVEYGRFNIRVNAIAPGSVRTDFARPMWGEPEKEAALARQTVVGRIGEPEEIAGPALMLASPAASFIAGQVLVVDGGRLAWRN